MVESEPLLVIDAKSTTDLHRDVVGILTVGKRSLALREATALDHIEMTGDLLKFA